MEGVLDKKIKIGKDRWRIVRIYVNRDLKEKWERVRGWMEYREERIRTIIGVDFNARIRELEEKDRKERKKRN